MPRTSYSDKRPRLDCSSGVKARIRALRESMGIKSDSEVIAYLLAFYDDHYEKITLAKDKHYRESAEMLDRQQSF